MSYTALYRKFRPVSFADVRGQDHIVTTLRNQLEAERIGHAYLFCGTRGTGKTTVAKILARAVNCEHPTEDGPCNACPTCQAILGGTTTNVIEIDAASNNGVDNIREIREEVTYRPTQGKYKVYIIDEVHMLSTGAFNALLKTLEEPPEYVIFILATTEVNKIPVTILSRCQRYNFRRISIETITARLEELLEKEKVGAEEKAVRLIARAADGSMRDALSLLDQCIAFYLGQELTFDRVLSVLGTIDTDTFSRLLRSVIAREAAEAIRILDEMIRAGKEIPQFITDFTWYMRNLLLVQSSDDLEEVLDVSSENLNQLREEAGMVPRDSLMRYIQIFSDLSGQVRFAQQKRILTEMALIRLCRPQMDRDLSGVLDRIRALEQKIEDGLLVAAPPLSGQPAPSGTGPLAEGKRQEEAAALKPAPEDLKKTVAQWGRIRGMVGGAVRTLLNQVQPKYQGDSGEAELILLARSGFYRDALSGEDEMAELRQAITKVTGLDIAVKVVTEEDSGVGRLSDLPIEQQLEAEIQVPIEEFSGEDDLFEDAFSDEDAGV